MNSIEAKKEELQPVAVPNLPSLRPLLSARNLRPSKPNIIQAQYYKRCAIIDDTSSTTKEQQEEFKVNEKDL